MRSSCCGNTVETDKSSRNADISFENWRVAFTVNLKLVDVDPHEKTITETILRFFGRQSKSSFKQLILDLDRK